VGGMFGRGQRCPLCRSDIVLPQLARLEARVERMEASMAELLSVMARMPNDMLSVPPDQYRLVSTSID